MSAGYFYRFLVIISNFQTDEKNGFLNQIPKQPGTFPRVRKTASESTVDGSAMSGQKKDHSGAKSAENRYLDRKIIENCSSLSGSRSLKPWIAW